MLSPERKAEILRYVQAVRKHEELLPKCPGINLVMACDETSWNELMAVLEEFGISLCEFGPRRTEEEKKITQRLSEIVRGWFSAPPKYGAPTVEKPA